MCIVAEFAKHDHVIVVTTYMCCGLCRTEDCVRSPHRLIAELSKWYSVCCQHGAPACLAVWW